MSIILIKNLEKREVLVYNYYIRNYGGGSMLERILEIIAKFAGVDVNSINEDTDILELDIDSLRVLKIIMEIEHVFNVRFEDEEIVEIRTAKDVERAMLKKFS